MKKTTTPTWRFRGQWNKFYQSALKDLGDGTCLLASITQDVDLEDFTTTYCATIERADYLHPYGLIRNRRILKRDTFSNLRAAVIFCETIDLGDLETTNE